MGTTRLFQIMNLKLSTTAGFTLLTATIDTWLRRHFRTPLTRVPKLPCRKRTQRAQRVERRNDFSGKQSDRQPPVGISPSFFEIFAFSRGQLRLSGLIATLVCGIGTMVTVPAQVLETIRPSETDPAIVQYNQPHYVYLNKEVTPRGLLFVFLPGTDCTPSLYTKAFQTASNLGFHTIGLQFATPFSVNTLCSNGSDSACFEQVRLEVIDGTNRTSLANVDRPNSIENRLIKLLLYLADRNPDDNWGQYLDAQTNLVWPKIVISGHSQGGTHAGLIAKYHPVARSIMFAGSEWWKTGESASGLDSPARCHAGILVFWFHPHLGPRDPLRLGSLRLDSVGYGPVWPVRSRRDECRPISRIP